MTIALRPLSRSDSSILAFLHALGADEVWDARAFATLLETPGVFGVLAAADQPNGFILCRAAADEAEVLTIFVPPTLRRQGIGAALLKRACVDARGKGAVAMFLEVAEDNDAARGLYAKHGFAEVGRRAKYYKGTTDALILKRPLVR